MAYTREQFIQAIAPYAKRDMEKNGILASITIAQAVLESENGNSKLATEHNNLFGMKGAYNGQSISMLTREPVNGIFQMIMQPFRVYPSWQESVDDHSRILSNSNYNLKGVTDYRRACYMLQHAQYKYAQDPNYEAVLKSLISQHNLTKYDKKQNVKSPAGNYVTGNANGPNAKKKKENTVNYAQQIVAVALKEQGNQGGQKFWSWYPEPNRVEWCAIFVSWCANQAGIPTSIIPKEEACWEILKFAADAGCYYEKGTYVPKMGDIFLFGGNHTGIVVSSDGVTFKTIEGNCSDMVAQREHSLGKSELTGFFSPNYPAVSGASTDGDSPKVYGKQVLKYLNDIAGQKKEEVKVKKIKVKDVVFKQSRLSKCQLVICHGKHAYTPVVKDGVTWSLERSGSPGQLSFSVIPDKKLKMEEGDAVQFRWNGQKVFYGFIFEKKETQDKEVAVTCYDQLRYLKNKDTYAYKEKRADEVIKMISEDFGMRVGSLQKTSYVIASKIEEDKTLFDIIDNALRDTLLAETKMYVLYDNFGKLVLKEISKMKTNIIIDAKTGQGYSYTTSINNNTYNKVKLDYANENTETRDIYIAKDSNNIKKWGVLQYYEKETSNVTINEGNTETKMITTDLKEKADSLLTLYNDATKRLQISKCFGDVNVRAGSSVIVSMKLHDMKISNYMMVEKVKHSFEGVTHTMDLTLIGGAFIA